MQFLRYLVLSEVERRRVEYAEYTSLNWIVFASLTTLVWLAFTWKSFRSATRENAGQRALTVGVLLLFLAMLFHFFEAAAWHSESFLFVATCEHAALVCLALRLLVEVQPIKLRPRRNLRRVAEN